MWRYNGPEFWRAVALDRDDNVILDREVLARDRGEALDTAERLCRIDKVTPKNIHVSKVPDYCR